MCIPLKRIAASASSPCIHGMFAKKVRCSERIYRCQFITRVETYSVRTHICVHWWNLYTRSIYIYVNIKCRHVCVSDVLGVLVYYVDTRLEVYCLRPFLVSQLENGEYAYTTADKSSSKASKDKLCLLLDYWTRNWQAFLFFKSSSYIVVCHVGLHRILIEEGIAIAQITEENFLTFKDLFRNIDKELK